MCVKWDFFFGCLLGFISFGIESEVCLVEDVVDSRKENIVILFFFLDIFFFENMCLVFLYLIFFFLCFDVWWGFVIVISDLNMSLIMLVRGWCLDEEVSFGG